MATEEIYIRSEAETEARGPFNLEQLVSLADNGQVTEADPLTPVGQRNVIVGDGRKVDAADARLTPCVIEGQPPFEESVEPGASRRAAVVDGG